VSNGTLIVNGSLASTTVAVGAGATLAGIGTIAGTVAVDGILSPGTNGIGAMTIGSSLTLSPGSTTTIAIDRAAGTNSYGSVTVITPNYVQLGGTLTVTNLGGAFQGGDRFTLFSVPGGFVNDFAATNLPTLTGGLVWNWDPTIGVLAVVSTALTPPVLSGYGPLASGSFPLTFSGPSGQSYTVLSSTNVALPLTDWMVLTTGTFGGSPVTYPDTNATNAHQFYRIVSP
jgi:hypothetical protein